MARADLCPRRRERLRPVAPEAGLEAVAVMETERAPAGGSRGRTRAAVAPREGDLREATQAWVALGRLGEAQEVVQGVARAMVAADQGHLIQEAVVARTLGATTTHQVEGLTRRVEAVAAADRIRPGDER